MSQSLNAAQRKIIFNALSVLKREGYGKKCFVDKTPFDGDEDEAINCVQENQINYVEIHLRLLPQSVPFNEGAFKAILSIPHDFPLRPPKIRVITPIHHPNIGPEGLMCLTLLRGNDQWTPTNTLIDVVNAAIHYIDNPTLDEAASKEIAEEYQHKRDVFLQNARQKMQQNPVPRT